ncbi:MAG: hypothetical protein JW751_13195 [Polyangiaceae bacterium]|nr:hypothetical protein [Polyangiaceae bacterium]
MNLSARQFRHDALVSEIRSALRDSGLPPASLTLESDASDCVLVHHTVDCCGTQWVMALSADEAESFAVAEAICEAQYPLCGCAPQGVPVDNGPMVIFGSEDAIVARCNDGQCQSMIVSPTVECGNDVCEPGQYCSTQVPGSGGNGPVSSCVTTDCTDCACLDVRLGCTCTDGAAGVISVHCDAV